MKRKPATFSVVLVFLRELYMNTILPHFFIAFIVRPKLYLNLRKYYWQTYIFFPF